jgi:hypothetical protein
MAEHSHQSRLVGSSNKQLRTAGKLRRTHCDHIFSALPLELVIMIVTRWIGYTMLVDKNCPYPFAHGALPRYRG